MADQPPVPPPQPWMSNARAVQQQAILARVRRQATFFDPPFTASVQPVAPGAAAVVVPTWVPIDAQPLRETLAEVARATLSAAQAAIEPLDLEFFALPCHCGGFVGVVVGGLVSWGTDDPNAGLGLGAVAALLVFVMIAALQYRQLRQQSADRSSASGAGDPDQLP
jgi:hypothetical protein